MSHRIKSFSFILFMAAILTFIPLKSNAAVTGSSVTMVAGEIEKDFVAAGTVCTSSDPAVAWVDVYGNLNAMKAGTATISVPSEKGEQKDYDVTVRDFSDGSEIVGNLKILARYNDEMQFYDGHVYLLFTSYQDGVDINVDDLYGAYEISDRYYDDIGNDISKGSNHTGKDTDQYFIFTKDCKGMTLNRGEIVTIGMYRGFDLTVPQAAFGCVKNSSLWSKLKAEGKAATIKTIFQFLETGRISTEEALARLRAVCDEAGVDYNKLVDGVVEGGVCFNRELYNQKLEWDQYENLTYELDITRNQLDALTNSLNGNLNKFSIMKNSCATVALRAWNAAVGIRDGEPTAYWLSASGEGIYTFIDAPKGVRDNIRESLPGYYLNNASGVAEPEAGYQDDTGWVYVSAPEKVTPVNFNFSDQDKLKVDAGRSGMSTLINAAKATYPDKNIFYNKNEQQVDVKIKTSVQNQITTINSVDFSVNGDEVSLNKDARAEDGIWFCAQVDDANQSHYYVTDEEGNVLASEYNKSEGTVSFHVDGLPVSFQIKSGDVAKNILNTTIVNGEEANAITEIYYKENGEKKGIQLPKDSLAGGTEIYIASSFKNDEVTADQEKSEGQYILSDIIFNGGSIFEDPDHISYDPVEGAYHVTMPEKYSALKISYEKAVLSSKTNTLIQAAVGDRLETDDYASLQVEGQSVFDAIGWVILDDENGVLVVDGDALLVTRPGKAVICACAKSNESIAIPYVIDAYENEEDMVMVTYDVPLETDVRLVCETGEDQVPLSIPFSGYKVKKGSLISIEISGSKGYAISDVRCNQEKIKAGDSIIADEDLEIAVSVKKATVKGIPSQIYLDKKGDSYQLQGKVSYEGLLSVLTTVYDPTIRYISSDPLLNVSGDGLITVTGDVPEQGKAVIVTAYAGSADEKVSASCKVILGDYDGARIVGRMTISARQISKMQLIAHGALTFTPYEDTDLCVSYYEYYRPNDRYNDIMLDYEAHPEKYPSDPAMKSEEINVDDREGCFDVSNYGAFSEPHPIKLTGGESITVSNYGFDPTNLESTILPLENSTLASTSENARILVEQMKKYLAGEDDFNGELTFDSFFAALMEMYAQSSTTGYNPANSPTAGGLCVNREIYKQFISNNTQFPNRYYTVEITADELASMKDYLANPANNYYSLYNKNCGTGAAEIWNYTLSDRPEYAVNANYTTLATDPVSLNYEILKLTEYKKLDGEGGKDFYPRTMRHNEIFETYKNEQIAGLEALRTDKDSKETKKRADDAIATIKDLSYDGSKTYEENKTAVLVIYQKAVADIEVLKKADQGAGTSGQDSQNSQNGQNSQSGQTDQTANRMNQMGEDGTALGRGASFEAANAAILAMTGGKDPAGSKISPLKLKSTKQTKASLKLTWKKVPGAVKYVVYGSKCTKAGKMKSLISIANTSATVKKIGGKKLKKGNHYKFMVIAVGKDNNVVTTSKLVFVATKGGKYGNPAALRVSSPKKKTKTILAGKTLKIKAKQKAPSGMKIKKYQTLRYESSDPQIATVSANGRVKALKAGTCKVMIYSQNGLLKNLTIKVK